MRLVSLLFVAVLITTRAVSQEVDTLDVLDLETNLFERPLGYQTKRLKIDSTTFSSSLASLMEQESSVFVKQYGPGNLATLAVRGTSSSQNQVFWNGIPMSSVTLGQVNLNIIKPQSSNSIEMVYGGGESGSYPGAIGSSLYLNNELEFNKKSKITYSSEYGDFETYRQYGIVSLSDSLLSLMFSWGNSRTQNNFEFYNPFTESVQKRERSKQTAFDLNGHLAFKINEHNRLKLNLLVSDSKQEIPRPLSINIPIEKQFQFDETGILTLGWQHNKGSKKISAQFGAQKLSNYFEDQAVSRPASKVLINQNFFQFRYSNRFGEKHKVLASFDAELSDVSSTGFTDEKFRNLTFINLGYQYKLLSDLNLSLNLKPIKINGSELDVISSFAFDYQPVNSLIFYGNVGNNVRYPTFNDLYWNTGVKTNLIPERSIQSQLGFEKQFKNGKVYVNAFQNIVKNWILWQPNSNGIWIPQNVHKVDSKGIEIGYSQSIRINNNSKLQFSTVGTLSSTKNTTLRKELIYMPKRKINTSLSYKYKSFKISVSNQFVSNYYISKDNSSFMPSYNVAHLSLVKSIKLERLILNLNLRVNNVFNSDFQVVSNQPMPRRYFVFGFLISNL